MDAHPEVRRHAPRRLDRSEVAQRVHRRDRVVVELAAVVDAAEPGPAQEVVASEDLEPEILDRLHLREEAMAADVEAPAVTLGGAADPADDGVGLEHGRGDPSLVQHVRRRETGGAGSDDDHVGRRSLAGGRRGLLRRLRRRAEASNRRTGWAGGRGRARGTSTTRYVPRAPTCPTTGLGRQTNA